MTQCDKILDFMKQHGAITPLDAMREFGCMRLAARINDLTKRGINIESTMVSHKNGYGDTVRYASYSLV